MALKGGEFLIKETLATDIFIPEEFDEDAKLTLNLFWAFANCRK